MTEKEGLHQRADALWSRVDSRETPTDATEALAAHYANLAVEYAASPGDTISLSKAEVADILRLLGDTIEEIRKISDTLFQFSDQDIPGYIQLLDEANDIISGHYERGKDREIIFAIAIKLLLMKDVPSPLKQALFAKVQAILTDFDEQIAKDVPDATHVRSMIDNME